MVDAAGDGRNEEYNEQNVMDKTWQRGWMESGCGRWTSWTARGFIYRLYAVLLATVPTKGDQSKGTT